MEITIYFVTNDRAIVGRIRDYFGITGGMTVNGEIRCNIDTDKLPALRETEKRGFIQIRNKK